MARRTGLRLPEQREEPGIGAQSQAALRARYPARANPASWTAAEQSPEELVELLCTGVRPSTLPSVWRGVTAVLGWLGTNPGLNWQEKWLASGVEEHLGHDSWKSLAEPWLEARGWDKSYGLKDLSTGLRRLICADAFRPSVRWMLSQPFTSLAAAMEEIRDPEGVARLRDQVASMTPVPRRFASGVALKRIATILATKGGTVADITVGDCIEILDTQDTMHSRGGQGKTLFYQLLVGCGAFPLDAPLSAARLRAR